MQKTFKTDPIAITPRDAAKFRRRFNEYELSVAAACPSSNSKNRLYSYTVKIVGRTLPGASTAEVSQIANAIANSGYEHGGIRDIINNMNKVPKDMPIFKKGWTFSSALSTFIKRVQCVAELQDVLAGTISFEINQMRRKF